MFKIAAVRHQRHLSADSKVMLKFDEIEMKIYVNLIYVIIVNRHWKTIDPLNKIKLFNL